NEQLPILFNLSYGRDAPNLIDSICDFFNRYNIIMTGNAFRGILNDPRYRLILLLDGLDEMVDRVEFERLKSVLEKIDQLKGVTGVKLVMTCRDTFFPTTMDIGIVKATKVLRLRTFEESQIHDYLRQWKPPLDKVADRIFQAD